MMPAVLDSDAADAYGLRDWSPDALDRLRRFVQILTEWEALERPRPPPLKDIESQYPSHELGDRDPNRSLRPGINSVLTMRATIEGRQSMSHTDIELPDIPIGDNTPAVESNHEPQAGDRVTVTFTPETDSKAAEQIPRLFPHAKEVIERRIITFSDGESGVDETRRFRCSFPTMEEARAAFRSLPMGTNVHLEAALTLDEEEFEALAQYHSNETLRSEWLLSCGGAGEWYMYNYHTNRLDELACVLGLETVRKILEEVRKNTRRRIERASALKLQNSPTNSNRPRARRRRTPSRK